MSIILNKFRTLQIDPLIEDENVKIKVIGRRDGFSQEMQDEIIKVEGMTQDHNSFQLNLLSLRDIGNSVIVVEHDKDMIEHADYVIDIGPAAGKFGGEIVSEGTPSELLKQNTLTAQYLNGTKEIEIPSKRRKGNKHTLELTGATGNNLKNVSVNYSENKGTFLPGFEKWESDYNPEPV